MKKQPKVKPYVAKDRLNALADFLDTVPKKSFNFSIFADGNLNECGTTGCALGWATTMTRFKRIGLELAMESDAMLRQISERKVILQKDGKKIAQHFGTAEHLFGISEHEAYGLFAPESSCDWQPTGLSPEEDATPKQVAKNIRKFIKWKWPND